MELGKDSEGYELNENGTHDQIDQRRVETLHLKDSPCENGSKKAAALMLATCFAALLIGWHFLSTVALTSLSKDYSVSDAGLLEYRIALPSYNITPGNLEENSSFSEVSFESRGAEIAAILRMPGHEIKKKIKTQNISGIVLPPGPQYLKRRSRAWPDAWPI